MGAGTDFDTKIVFKPRRGGALARSFEKPRGKASCHVQRRHRLLSARSRKTRADAAVPRGVSRVSQPGFDHFEERTRRTRCRSDRRARARSRAHFSVSSRGSMPSSQRTIEPWAASPQRRLKVIETFAKAGVPVGMMMAPIIPGSTTTSWSKCSRPRAPRAHTRGLGAAAAARRRQRGLRGSAARVAAARRRPGDASGERDARRREALRRALSRPRPRRRRVCRQIAALFEHDGQAPRFQR